MVREPKLGVNPAVLERLPHRFNPVSPGSVHQAWHSSCAPPFDVGEEDQGKNSGFTLIEEQLLLSERLPEAILGMRFKLCSGFGNS